MKKLLFKIKNNSLLVKEKTRLNNEYKNILDTNVISCNELVFSYEYLQNNIKILSTFFKELCNDYNINTLVLEKNEDAITILNLFKNNNLVTNLILKEENQITFKICETLTQTNIKNISCYNLQPFMIEYLDKYNILVESRNEILYLSNFMIQNNLTIFSSLFYKITLQVDLPLSTQDMEDFEAFIKINKYLKYINVHTVSKNDLEYIIKTLRNNNKKNIKIIIHDNITDEEIIDYLKNYNKKYAKRYKIYFRLVYSNEYLKENFLKQANNSLLKGCGYVILLIITLSGTYVFYDNYKSMENVKDIQTSIKENISNTDTTEIIEELNKDKQKEDKLVVNEDIVSVYNINPETVGWLKVNNTNIDYPVVKTDNNDYYLTHNINFEPDNNGWVFMDYRNDLNLLSDNIIVYAHNRYYNGVMFGTLQNTQRRSWYTNADNQIITLKTLYEELHYKIFSIYKVEITTDYLQVLFASDEDKLNLFKLIKTRSIYDFGIDLTKDDKILTLSTCADENNRYVVHAVLQK